MTDRPEKTLKGWAANQLRKSAEVKRAMEKDCLDSILAAAGMIAGALQDGRKVMFCGNGGSAADSQHLATEFIVRLSAERERRALPAIALTTDTSTLTAAANDYGFDRIFARQVEALGKPGDVLVCISTSGNSPNVVAAAETARQMEIKVVGLLGQNPGKLAPQADVAIHIPSDVTNRIQEGHITAGHLIVALTEELLFGGSEV